MSQNDLVQSVAAMLGISTVAVSQGTPQFLLHLVDS